MVRSAITVFLCAVTLCAPAGFAAASASPDAIAVLDTEQRWLHAIANRDARALAGILGEHFVHITYAGAIRYREQELAAVLKPKLYEQRASEQTVDFAGDTAIVHGVNIISQSRKPMMRLRYTDVYERKKGKWMAISAQETAITK